MQSANVFFVVALALLFPLPVSAAPPANFQTTQIIGTGLDGPSGFEFAPDGRIFILERAGKVKIYKNGNLLAEPFVDLPSMASGDRGLIGIAFDPDFAGNRYVYFYYTGLDKLNRLVRCEAWTDTCQNKVQIYQTYSPSEELHVGGSIRFGPDGKTYFAVGDNGYSAQAQWLDNPHGKIHRINKDGTIPADNPFYGTPGALKEIWAYGFRNPWRFQFDSATGAMYGGDVGDNTWEEVNKIEKGKNYGWPQCEGYCSQGGTTNPIHAYNHDGLSSAVTGGPVYRATMFPPEYRDSFFFGDYARGFIKRIDLDINGNNGGVYDFDLNAGSVVDLKVASDGSLYYITYYPGRMYRITFATGNHAPVANAQADKTKGVPPFTVHFSSDGSYDPDGDPLTYVWNFGDGTASTAANPTKTYPNKGTYTVEMRVSDGTESANAIPIVIQVGIPPTVSISRPANGSTYKAGDTVTYNAHAVDGTGNDINDGDILTDILFHHGTHIHPFLDDLKGRENSFAVPTTGEPAPDTSFEIVVTATDTSGLSSTKSVSVVPLKSYMTFATVPANLQFSLDSRPLTAPHTVQGVVNFQREISAPLTQAKDGKTYRFARWSDGGARTHLIHTPDVDTTYIAFFEEVATTPFDVQYFANKELSGTPALTRTDASINFDWGAGSPDPQLPVNQFSARWTKTETFSEGTYEFITVTDDGIRISVDGNLVLDAWVDQSPTEHKASIFLTEGAHTIVVEYYENYGDAVAKVSWTMAEGTTCGVPAVGAFSGCYYDNMDLTNLKVVREDAYPLNFDWGVGTPDPALGAEAFSATWEGTFPFDAKDYQFSVTADDGVRVFVDGVMILDKWIDQSTTTYLVTKTLTAGQHTIRMEYYENGYDAVAKLSWIALSGGQAPPAGFVGKYYANKELGGTPVLARTDASINFDWGTGSPADSVPVNQFSAHWEGTQGFDAGTHIFTVTADDGVRLTIDGTTVIDQWKDQAPTTYTKDVTLTAGSHAIAVDYYENYGDAVAKVSWTAGTSGGQFAADFYLSPNINSWWEEVDIRPQSEVVAADFNVNGGPWIAMTKKSWGNWAANEYVATGSNVQFRARNGSGLYAYSQIFVWP